MHTKSDETSLQVKSGLITARQWVPRPLPEVFAFFAAARNLELITPRWLRFQVLSTSTPEIGEGTLIDYKLSLFGIPMRWQSRIEDWRPGAAFVDTQTRGPYAHWRHLHTFKAENGGTLVEDHVEFRVPLGTVGEVFGGAFVRSTLRRIFGYRQKTIGRRFVKEGAS